MPHDPNDPIKHVVLLMLENRSFDQMLGCLQQLNPDIDGVPDPPTRFNADSSGRKYFQTPDAARQMEPDPHHEHRHVVKQLENDSGGFVLDYQTEQKSAPSPDQLQQIMSYYHFDGDRQPDSRLPALHELGQHFTVCDRWFASVPGPTWTNRFFALSGTSSGQVDMPEPGLKNFESDIKKLFNQTQDTIFDRLHEANRSWWIYYYDIPCSLILAHQRLPHQLEHYRQIDRFFDQDVKDESTFPDFVFIEPKYFGTDENDNHPPHNVIKGEKLIADVYDAIRSNAELWNSTLLIVAFDEHGGFYDHVTPPAATPPAPFKQGDEYTFDQYGVRVPAILVSPWAAAGVSHTQFDHTSVLKYLIEKWDLGALGARTASANSIGPLVTGTRRDDTPAFIRVANGDLIPDQPDLERKSVSVHHEALQVLAMSLNDDLARRGDAFAAGEIALLVEGASKFEMTKASIGALLIRIGTSLTRGLEENTQRRTELIRKAVQRLLRREGVATGG